MTAPTVPERTTKRADQLVPGDMLHDELFDEPAPVLFATPFTDCGSAAVLAVFRSSDGVAYPREFDAAAELPVQTAPEPVGYQVLAADLRKIADLFDQAGHVEMAEQPYIHLDIQPDGTDEQIIERIDALGYVLLGKPGEVRPLGGGSHFHYGVEGKVGMVALNFYDAISNETVRAREAAALAAANEAEIAELRARIAELEGLTYSREDDDPQVVRPHSPRVPMHVGTVVGGGELVDATPRPGTTCEQLSDGEKPECSCASTESSFFNCEVHGEPAATFPTEAATGYVCDGCGGQAETWVDGRPVCRREPEAQAAEAPASGLTPAAEQSRGVLAGTTPVVTYFSFGHGQTDPDSGQSLLDHYVTVVAPTYEECREAMFASRFGRAWSFDYLAGRAKTTEWVSRWTEHEVIVAPGTDPAAAETALKAAADVLAVNAPTCPGGC